MESRIGAAEQAKPFPARHTWKTLMDGGKEGSS
jgi:hypothetical protein